MLILVWQEFNSKAKLDRKMIGREWGEVGEKPGVAQPVRDLCSIRDP